MLESTIRETARALRLPYPFPATPAYLRIADAIADRASEGRPQAIGICGSQGSGKSTMTAFVAAILEARGVRSAVLSLDDLYLDPENRPVDIHPLFATRGVPGTHEVALGVEVIDRLTGAAPGTVTPIPRFDKAADRRLPEREWERFHGRAAVVILEGWCIGVPPQGPDALAAPINALESVEDAEGIWRGHVDACLAGPYRALFARLSLQAFLAAPGFDCVHGWRRLQEDKLRARSGPDAPGLMDDAALTRFIQHYERLTRHALAVMPGQADMLVTLDTDQAIIATSIRPQAVAPSGSR